MLIWIKRFESTVFANEPFCSVGRSRPHYQRNVINKIYCLTFMEFSKRDWEKNKRTNLATTAEHISGDFFFYLIIKTEIYFFFRSFKDRIQLKQNQYFLVVYLIILQHAHRNQIGFFHVWTDKTNALRTAHILLTRRIKKPFVLVSLT